MADQIIKVPHLLDKEIIDFLVLITGLVEEPYTPKRVSLQVIGTGNREYELANLKQEEFIIWAIQKNLATITQFALNFTPANFSLRYARGGESQSKSPRYDEIRVYWPDNNKDELPTNVRLAILEVLFTRLSGILPEHEGGAGAADSVRADAEFTREMTRRMQATGERFAENIVELEQKLHQILIAKSNELEAQFRVRVKHIEKEYQERKVELEEKKAELESKQKQFDVREPRYVRRQLRSELLDEIKRRSQTFELTRGTRRLRWPVHIIVVLLVGFLFTTPSGLTGWLWSY